MRVSTGDTGGRPVVMGRSGAVASGHYLATAIGLDVLRRGGNAMDAASAVGFALTVLKPHQNGIGGEVPALFYTQADGRVRALSGHGVAPRQATIEHFLRLGIDIIPGDGLLPALVPAAPAAWIRLLQEFGTMRLADVLTPAIELAEEGFAVYDSLHESIAASAERFASQWPSSAEQFLIDGAAPPLGVLWRQPQLASMFNRLLYAEAAHADRADGLAAAHWRFYRGDIATQIVAFCVESGIVDATGQPHHGLLSEQDFAQYDARFEEPVHTQYRGIDIYKCSTWTQGPALLEALNLLERFELRKLTHNSAEYLHLIIEAIKLAYADREFYYGDPLFAEVPLQRLLSKEYAAERVQLLDPARASLELRPGGRPPLIVEQLQNVEAVIEGALPPQGDTTKLEVVDRFGNFVSATPSGGWLMSSPVIPGLGFPLGTRGQMFSLRHGHPNCLAPGKRPRTTLTPSIAIMGGKRILAFGSPGGDAQDQWALQFLLNVAEFGMSLQQAIEAPTVNVLHFPSSFYPRRAEPGVVSIENRVDAETCARLSALGHRVRMADGWSQGNTLAVALDAATGVRSGAASPRLDPAYALAY